MSAHRSTYPDPVRFEAGDVLPVGRRDDEYPGWAWVRDPGDREGWAPACILEMDGHGAGTALEAYCARELDTEPGERLGFIRLLEGWVLAANSRGETGWVPLNSVEPVRPVGVDGS